LNQNSIQDGVLIGLLANLGPGTANGTYPLKLSDVFGCDEEGRGAPGTATDGSVTIREGPGEILRLRPEGVLNGASLMTGSVAPGQILTLIGSGIGPEREQVPDPLPSSTTLRGVSVLFDGSPAPLLYASRSQINVIAPFRLESGTFTELRIAGVGQTLATITLPVTAASPSIFTLDASGVGPGAILNQDSTVNSGSNPADRGSVVVIFAMGAGQTDPPGKDGEVPVNPPPKPILPVSAEIGGIEAEILFAGSAPGLVSGVLQVNCRVPTGLVPSLTAPVLLRVGTAVSQPGVTLAIR
jgi:uncharacterized protein (TIGR03437 family)